MELRSLEGQRVGLLGVGIDMAALVPHIVRVGATSVCAFDDGVERFSVATTELLARSGIEVRPTSAIGERPLDVVVRSPGFNRYRGELDELRSVETMTTPIDLWLGTHGATHHVTLVTGTKGKSTTTSAFAALIAHLEPIVMGNIGVPAWSIDGEAAASGRPVICELSSFQAADTTYVADLAVLTVLGVDHVDWHGTVERYQADKLGPVRRARIVIAGAADPATAAAVAECDGELVTVDSVSAGRSPELRALLGAIPRHLADDFALALTAAECVAAATLDDAWVIETLDRLEALPGRQRSVGSVRGVEAVDDALASNPLAGAVALDSYPGRHVWMIVGGADRGVPLTPLIDALDRRRDASVCLIGIPHSGAVLCDELGAHRAVRSTLLAESIQAAVDAVEPIGADDLVLFSPCAPTPTEMGSWVDRSAAFVAAVAAGEQGSLQGEANEVPEGEGHE